MNTAPFRQLQGDALPPATGYWLTAADGVRLRAACWHAAAASVRAPPPAGGQPSVPAPPLQGTVLLFPGRSEYVEKYAPVATRLTQAGLTVLGIDWRGQGLSQRLLDDPVPGHVTDFLHYQRDVEALLGLAEGLDLPRPWRLLAHSMGGAIGLRALTRGLPVAAAAFSAPMWGIRVGRMSDALGARVATGLAALASWVGRGTRGMPGASGVLEVAFAGNALTGDVGEYTRFMREAAAWPDIILGTASWTWAAAAMAESRALAALPSPAIPALISVSGAEAIVSPAAIRARAAAWPAARLLEVPGAHHEALFEVPRIREPFLDAILDRFRTA